MGDPAAKPLDVGSGRVCASFDAASAAWLSIGAPHPTHGFVELSALPRFDEARRGDPAATRLYREAMTRVEHAFLRVEIDGRAPELLADIGDPARPTWSARGVDVCSAAEPDGTVIRQSWSIGPSGDTPSSVTIRVRGTLDRPALAEITEVDPPAGTGATTELRASERGISLVATRLPARAAVAVSGAPVNWALSGADATGAVQLREPPARLELTIEVSLLTPAASDAPESPPTAPCAPVDGDGLVARAVAYVRGCTALAVAPDERAILTDHRILPLSWTRDAYWQALGLLAADAPGDRRRVADHLRWLWRRCERPDGRWVRSHHADGRRKDLAFQADQMLYPMIELADYWRATGDLPAGVDWDAEIPRAADAVLAEVDAATGFVASTENAADDPATAPFIASSQIVLWYAAERIGELVDAGVVHRDLAALRRAGTAVRSAFRSSFASGGGPWPYAVDRDGGRVDYHDANDLPVALAPLWGFCGPRDPGWAATMAFAFSEANPGWCTGERAGLGSLHTPGPWTLGDIQGWIRARALGDAAGMTASIERLREVAFHDGMLPEAYAADPRDGRRIRHWFAWPGAVMSALLLLDRRGLLEQRLTGHSG